MRPQSSRLKCCSERLEIVPLWCDEVGFLATDKKIFEDSFAVPYDGEPLVGHLLEVTQGQYKKIFADQENYLWHTFWMIVLKTEKTIIGSADFKGPPNESGVVEIGYGTNEAYRNQGYTSEAIRSMCNWAFEQPGIKEIHAETEKENIPSHRVLQKCGFEVFNETQDCLWWKLTISDDGRK